MGCRADFYVGLGPHAEWIGSVDGYGEPQERDIREVFQRSRKTIFRGVGDERLEAVYRDAVAVLLAQRKLSTSPDMGWPWPWEDSSLTDYAYAYVRGTVRASHFGGPWFDALYPKDELTGAYAVPRATFPKYEPKAERVIQAVREGRSSVPLLLEDAP